MDARSLRAVGLALGVLASLGASVQTRNFIVHTADPRHASAFAQQAEHLRRELAIAWLGHPLPDWSYPCPITATVGPHLGAGGATSFVFDRGEVFGWRMTIQGSYERILDSVLPHEITHMIFASHFRRPLPRWADEGGATTMEHESEKNKHRQMLLQFLRSQRGIPFNQMFAMTEYPPDIMPLYAQGYAVAEYLIQQGGRRKYIDFLADGLAQGRWAEALQKHYGIQDLGTLQTQWVAWVARGFPPVKPSPDKVLPAGGTAPSEALAASQPPSPNSPPVSHLQSPAPSASAGTIGPSPLPVPSPAPISSEVVASTRAPGPLATSTNSFATSQGLSPTDYRPGSTGRSGVVWTQPLAPLPAPSPAETSLAATSPQKSLDRTSAAERTAPAQGDPSERRNTPGVLPTAASPNDSSDGQGEQFARNAPRPAPASPGRVGPDGWFTAGTRPAYAPGSVGRAYSGVQGTAQIGSSAAVSNQLTRPQMPDSSPRILLQWPTTTWR